MTRIVTTHYRYKRPPKRKAKAALEVPAIVRKRAPLASKGEPEAIERLPNKPSRPAIVTPAAPQIRSEKGTRAAAPAIVTIRRRKHAMHAHLLEDITPEEHQRRGDASVALWRELVRAAAKHRR